MSSHDIECNPCSGVPDDSSYPCTIPQIEDGEAINAAITNESSVALAQRTEYLKCYLESLEIGTAHFVHDVVLAPTVKVGHIVYFDINLSLIHI